MTIVLPISSDPSAVREKTQSRGHWGRLPTKAKVGAVLLAFFILVGLIGPFVAPYNPSFQNPSPNLSLAGPSAAHLLGTTTSGQDVFSQLLSGIRLTLVLGFVVGVVATALSVIVGVSAGFLGGVGDELLSLTSNVFLVLPALPLLVVLLGYVQETSQWPTILVLSVLGWPWGARVVRSQTLAIRNRDFVAASRETGERGWHIIVFDIVPNEISLIAASFVNTVLYAVAASVALAFIGVADLNSWSLGTMLYWAEGQQALTLGAWWWFIPPGLAVALIGTSLVLLNFGIDEIGNPRLRDAAGAKRRGLSKWSPSDPTPVVRSAARPAVAVGTWASSPHTVINGGARRDETDGGAADEPTATSRGLH
jgi:peptide/nickel transport system permease protein